MTIRFEDRKRDWKSDRRKSKVGCKQNPIQTSSTQENVKCVECRALHGWWLHAAAGLFCKCHSFGRRARAVVKTNLVGIARFFNTLVFSFHCEQLIWNPYRALLYYIFYRSRHTLFICTSFWKLKTKQFYENSTSQFQHFPSAPIRLMSSHGQDWCVDRSIASGDDAWG